MRHTHTHQHTIIPSCCSGEKIQAKEIEKKWPISKNLSTYRTLLDNICKLAFQSSFLVKARVKWKKRGRKKVRARTRSSAEWWWVRVQIICMLKTLRISTNPTVCTYVCVRVYINSHTNSRWQDQICHAQLANNNKCLCIRQRERERKNSESPLCPPCKSKRHIIQFE